MKFKITYGKDKEKIIEAKDLENAENKAPKTWVNIIMVEKSQGIAEY